MASGRSHDRVTWCLALPFGLLWWPWLGLIGSAVTTVCFLLGGLLLSPDLDTRSNATRRWGPLRVLWWPYRKLLRHRSPVSHSPLIGTAVRLTYLFSVLLAMSWLAQPLGAPAPTTLTRLAEQAWRNDGGLLSAGLVAVEASAWLHLIQDGDPGPSWPGPRRRGPRSRRRRGSRLL